MNSAVPLVAIGPMVILLCVVGIARRDGLMNLFSGFLGHRDDVTKPDGTPLIIAFSFGLIIGVVFLAIGVSAIVSG